MAGLCQVVVNGAVAQFLSLPTRGHGQPRPVPLGTKCHAIRMPRTPNWAARTADHLVFVRLQGKPECSLHRVCKTGDELSGGSYVPKSNSKQSHGKGLGMKRSVAGLPSCRATHLQVVREASDSYAASPIGRHRLEIQIEGKGARRGSKNDMALCGFCDGRKSPGD